MTRRKTSIVKILFFMPFMLFMVNGCSGLRFAPTEPQKEISLLTYELAQKVSAEGTSPASPASNQLVKGARAGVAYTGLPASPADPAEFDTVAAQANSDAQLRPGAEQVFDAIDRGLSLGWQIAILFGAAGAGVAGKKVGDWIAEAQTKSKALRQIVLNSEKYKEAAPDKGAAFKAAQTQSPETQVLVRKIIANAF